MGHPLGCVHQSTGYTPLKGKRAWSGLEVKSEPPPLLILLEAYGSSRSHLGSVHQVKHEGVLDRAMKEKQCYGTISGGGANREV